MLSDNTDLFTFNLSIFQCMNAVIVWFERHLQTCPYKSIFGIDCPGCGMQRSFVELLKGNFFQSFLLYPALIPLILMIAFLILHLRFRFNHGAGILKYSFIINVCIIFIHYFSKFI